MTHSQSPLSRLIELAQQDAASLSGHLTALECALKQASTDRGKSTIVRGERRATRGKIEADAELETFIRARIVTQTFPEVAAAVAAHFPPDRRVTMSTIHRWWHRAGKHATPPQSANLSRS